VPQMLPTDEDFDTALDEFDHIFRRIPPPAWAHHEMGRGVFRTQEPQISWLLGRPH
jgi:hypothetical protein